MVPIDRIKSPSTRFATETVDDVETDRHEIRFADGSTMDFDYAVDCLGSRTAFYGIDGLETLALTLESLEDALAINEQIVAPPGTRLPTTRPGSSWAARSSGRLPIFLAK